MTEPAHGVYFEVWELVEALDSLTSRSAVAVFDFCGRAAEGTASSAFMMSGGPVSPNPSVPPDPPRRQHELHGVQRPAPDGRLADRGR